MLDFGTFDGSFLVEMDVDVLAEATRVVITNCLRITKCLENGVRLEDLLLDPVVLAANCC